MGKTISRIGSSLALLIAAGIAGPAQRTEAQHVNLPMRLQDRGAGVPASIFGIYIERGQLLIYPFYSYERDHNFEYQPAKWGYGLNDDFRGKYWSHAGEIFLAYGLTGGLAFELEAAVKHAGFEKSPSDPSATPASIEESGFGDVEAQLRMRLLGENERRPELFGFVEATVPTQTDKVLIGDPDWDLRPGVGVIRGFSWGTVTFRTTVEYNRDDKGMDLGETSLEYLKRLSQSWRLNLAIEGGETGAPDEWDLVTGVLFHVKNSLSLKFDNALGLSSKATDWAPQAGFVFVLPH